MTEISLRKRLGSGITWNTIATVFNQGSIVLVAMVLARLLSKESFGDFIIIQSTILGILGISQQLLGMLAAKYVAELRNLDIIRLGRVIGLCAMASLAMALLAAIVLLLGGGWIASFIFGAAKLELSIKISAGIVLFSILGCYQVGLLSGLESFLRTAWASILSGTVFVAIMATSGWFWGLQGALVGWLVSAIIRWMIFHYVLLQELHRQNIITRFRGIWREWSIILDFALPSALSGFTAMSALWLANVILYRQPNGNGEMAIFGAALNIRQAVLLLPGITNNVVMVLMSNQYALGNQRRYRKLFWTNLSLTTLVAVGAAGTLVLFGPELLRVLGKSFLAGTNVLTILMVSAVAVALTNAIYQVFLSQGRLWLSFFAFSLPRDIALVTLAWLLSPMQGAVGLAWAHTSSYLLVLTIVVILTCRSWLRTAVEMIPQK